MKGAMAALHPSFLALPRRAAGRMVRAVGQRHWPGTNAHPPATEVHAMQVSQILTRDVETLPPDATVKEAAQRMRSGDIGSLPVCDGRRLLGMVTDRDITIRITAEGRDAAITPVMEAMTPDVTFVFDDQDVQEAARIMKDRQ